MKRTTWVLLLFLTPGIPQCYSQSEESDSLYYRSHCITGGIGMGSFFYVQFKYQFFNLPHFQTNVLGGFGAAPGDVEGGLSSHRNIVLGISQSVCIRPMFLSVGIVPIVNFYENVTYTNINGLIGLKYEPKSRGGTTIEIGYLPILYKTHDSDAGFPFYLGFGASF